MCANQPGGMWSQLTALSERQRAWWNSRKLWVAMGRVRNKGKLKQVSQEPPVLLLYEPMKGFTGHCADLGSSLFGSKKRFAWGLTITLLLFWRWARAPITGSQESECGPLVRQLYSNSLSFCCAQLHSGVVGPTACIPSY